MILAVGNKIASIYNPANNWKRNDIYESNKKDVIFTVIYVGEYSGKLFFVIQEQDVSFKSVATSLL